LIGLLAAVLGACSRDEAGGAPVAGKTPEAAGSPHEADQPSSTIEVTAFEWGFSPNRLEVPADTAVTLVLRNVGLLEHDFQLKADSAVHVSVLNEGDDRAHAGHSVPNAPEKIGPIHLYAAPGSASSATYVVSATGEFEFVCEFPGHREAGMVGRVVFEPPQG
jgi:uncharacterized cupredoxin-like copper-binding protein